MAIAYCYRFILSAPTYDEWNGEDSTVNQICKILQWKPSLNTCRKIVRVLKEYDDYLICTPCSHYHTRKDVPFKLRSSNKKGV